MNADALIGVTVGGRYEVVRLIGRGAMGAIYEVQHTRVPRRFALKCLAPHLSDSPEALDRFRREADLVASLHHPNVVEIVDWETLEDGSPCFVMELLRGEDLEQRLRREGAQPWRRLLRIADQVLSALSVAHKAGIVHRDLKPQNIFLATDDTGDERVKLLDFGISKVVGADGGTRVNQLLGTPRYMAPELADARPEDVGPATDLWALGAIVHEMATGAPAFPGSSARAVQYRICHGEPEPLTPKRSDAPPEIVALVRRAMTRDDASRLRDTDAMRAALRTIAASMPQHTDATVITTSQEAAPTGPLVVTEEPAQTAPFAASPEATHTRTTAPPSRRRSVVAAAVALGAITIAIAVVLGVARRSPMAAPPSAIPLVSASRTKPTIPASVAPTPTPVPTSVAALAPPAVAAAPRPASRPHPTARVARARSAKTESAQSAPRPSEIRPLTP